MHRLPSLAHHPIVNPGRPRVALCIPGGAGAEGSGHFIPALHALIEGLAEEADLTVHSLGPRHPPSREGSCGRARVIHLGASPGGAAKVLLLARSVAAEHGRGGVDLVHGVWALPSGLGAVLAARLLGARSLVTVQGGEHAAIAHLGYGSMLRARTRFPTLLACRRADALAAVSEHQAEALRGLGVRRAPIHVIPYGSPLRVVPRRREGLHPGPLRFLAVASIHPLKGHETLLRAFALIRATQPAVLRVVGEDQRGGAMRALASDLGVERDVEWAGEVPASAMHEQYAWGDILLHTSLHEAQPVVLAEAASAGLLAAGSRTGLLADLSPGAAVGVPPGDHEALAREILHLLADAGAMERRREALHLWARVHTMEWTVQQYAALYRELAAAR